jgi:hypothetical protein
MLLLVTLLALVIVRSGRIAAARGQPSSGMAPAVFLAGAGLAAGGFFLHVWDAFEVSLPFFALAALAVNEERPQVAKDEGWR